MLDKVIVQTARQGQDPAQTENVSADLLTPWGEIPIACGFRVTRHKHNGPGRKYNGHTRTARLRRATASDQVAQQQAYAQCMQWSSLCGLIETEFKDELESVPGDQQQRGREGIAVCLQQKNATRWEHAKLKCVEAAIRKAAQVAAKEVGSQELATKAGEEISEWLSSENARLSRLATLPKQWRGKQGVNLPTNCHQYLGHVIMIACLLCLHSLP